ncbi:MAG: BatD family protein [Acidobacteriota bacterium]
MTPRAAILGPLLALLTLAGGSSAGAQQVTVAFDPSGEVGVDEVLQLTIRIEASGSVRVTPPAIELDNLEIVGGPSRTTSVQFVNGRRSDSQTFVWSVRPRALGTAGLSEGRVAIGSDIVDLPQRTVSVVENPPQRVPRARSADPFDRMFGRDPFGRDRRRRGLDDFFNRRRVERREPEIFLEASLLPRQPWVGQQALYTLHLYTDVGIRSVTPSQLPDFKGFWTQVLPQETDSTPERVVRDGREIYRIKLLQRALFPRRAESLRIEPVATRMVVARQGFGSPFEDVGEIERRSNPLQIEVRELPEPAPPSFNGAVGDLRLEAELEPRQLQVGEAATLRLTLAGRGHLKGLLPPTLDVPTLDGVPAFEVFDPQTQSSEEVRGTQVVGEKVWSYVLLPQRPGTIELADIEIPYFNARTSSYEVTSVSDLTLDVAAATRLERAGGSVAELHPIRQISGAPPSQSWPWRLWLFASPLVAAACLLIVRRTTGGWTRTDGSPAPRRHLLRALDDAAQEDRASQLAARLEAAWRHFLEARWALPPGLASRRWSEELVARGAAADAVSELVQLQEDLHYLRYAPKLSETDEMRDEVLARSRKLARRLR